MSIYDCHIHAHNECRCSQVDLISTASNLASSNLAPLAWDTHIDMVNVYLPAFWGIFSRILV